MKPKAATKAGGLLGPVGGVLAVLIPKGICPLWLTTSGSILPALGQAVRDASCSSCDIQVLDMKAPEVAARAKQLGINRVPAVVINGQLADCCSSGAIDVEVLRSMGLGQA